MPGVDQLTAAKRALVKVLRDLALLYDLDAPLNRDSSVTDAAKAFKKVVAKVHPDKGGILQDSQRLHAARDTWQVALKANRRRGRPAAETAGTPAQPTMPPTSASKPKAAAKEKVTMPFAATAPKAGSAAPSEKAFHATAGEHCEYP